MNEDKSVVGGSATDDETQKVNDKSVVAEGAPGAQVTDQNGEDEKQKRILDLEKEAAYYKGVAESAARVPIEEKARKPEVTELKPPKMDDFATFEEYEVAREDYLIRKAEKRARESYHADAQRAEAAQVERKFREQINKAVETDPNIARLLTDKTFPVSDSMAFVIKRSDIAPKILRYLNENRSESLKISEMSPIEAATRLGEISAEIKAKDKKVEPTKQVSQAPNPIQTVKSTGSMDVDEDKLSTSEWIKRRNEKQFGKRR